MWQRRCKCNDIEQVGITATYIEENKHVAIQSNQTYYMVTREVAEVYMTIVGKCVSDRGNSKLIPCFLSTAHMAFFYQAPKSHYFCKQTYSM